MTASAKKHMTGSALRAHHKHHLKQDMSVLVQEVDWRHTDPKYHLRKIKRAICDKTF